MAKFQGENGWSAIGNPYRDARREYSANISFFIRGRMGAAKIISSTNRGGESISEEIEIGHPTP